MKKGFTLVELVVVIVILSLIALIVYPSINSVIRSSREKAYNDQVAIIIKAAKQWGIDNPDLLPDYNGEDNSKVYVSLSDLTKYLGEDSVTDPRNKKKILAGVVEISYSSGQYVYRYTEKESKDSLVNTLNIGVLKANGGIFKGDNPDNYVKVNNKIWRIISINNGIKLVLNDGLNRSFDTNGVSDFASSILHDDLNSNFDVSGLRLISQSYGSVGIISLNDYMNASNDLNCTTGLEEECANGNFLASYSKSNGAEYTLTSNGNSVYRINSKALASNTIDVLKVRPVIVLKSDYSISSGTGSLKDPYILT